MNEPNSNLLSMNLETEKGEYMEEQTQVSTEQQEQEVETMPEETMKWLPFGFNGPTF